ncbi:DUF6799 domain-containing protein [Hymenobacter jeollabukensis]|uniref:DUF6799 domain-containing protein n=1 Tax=Hymenobacter jeollabukensis TaxID=2025313 RepID=A0A5R8WKW6_9BACT|nr:DUF6799 domain-containing protein [Hymenobacter jeollabukensis]TLM89484.1 hypothetical protein FDY95_20645 [Hymenobacter jeollabukensis]
MKNFLLFLLLWVVLIPSRLVAQSTGAAGFTSWFAVKDNALVVQTNTKTTPLTKSVVLINGTRLDYQSRTAMLPGGQKVVLREGDTVTLYGEVHQAKETPTATAAPVTPAPTPAPAPAAQAPATAVASAAPMPAAPAPAVKPAPVNATPASFTFRPAAPVGGKLRGVVELGASGFNSFIVRIDADKNWKLEKSEFGNSLVMENLATEDDIRKGLKTYIGKMLDYGVGGRDIHFVVSSGAVAAEGTQKIIKALRAMNYVVLTVTPEREAALGLRAALPAAYADKAFLVDMGSGNTKLAWLETGMVQTADTYGSKYFQKNTDPAAVAADVQSKAQQVPAEERATCFIIGGIPYELAKPLRHGTERYTVLKAPAAYASLEGAKAQAGVNIYQALAKATGCQQFVFDWDANFTIGYLLTLP